jgi:hypothetical protein
MALRDMPDHDDRPEVVALFANLTAGGSKAPGWTTKASQ